MNKENHKENPSILKYLKMNAVIVFAMVIVIIIFQFISFDKGADNNIANNSTSIPKLTEDDKKFQNWTNSLSEHMQSDLYCITKSAEKKNLTDMEICGRILKENSNRSLMQISKFNVSPSFEMAISEYKKSLELYYLAGKNLEIGAKNYDTDLMVNATIYIDQGKKKMTNAHYLITLVS